MPTAFIAKVLAVGALILAIGGMIFTFVLWHQRAAKYARDTAFLAGQTVERLVWEEKQAKALLEAQARQKAAQAQIARIETEYWKRNASDREMIADLQEALDDEKQDDAVAAEPGSCTPPSVSKRVRDNLNRIGRD